MAKNDLDKLINCLDDIDKNLDDDVMNMLYNDASELGDVMLDGYNNYVATNTYHRSNHSADMENEDFSYLMAQIGKNGKEITEDKPARVWILRDGRNGVRVGLRGDTVAYYEFGTGTHNNEEYPDQALLRAVGWQYGSGSKILQHGKWKNAYANKVVPKWYKTSLAKGIISDSDMVWMYNGYLRRGLPPGAFIYNAIEEYTDDVDGVELSENETHEYRVSKKGIYSYLSQKLNIK